MLRKGRFRVFLDAFMNPTTTATSSQEGESSSPSTSAAPATSNGLDGDATENKDGDVTPVPTWRSAAKMATFYNVLCSVAHKVGYNPSTISVDHHAVVPNCIRWGRKQFLSLSDEKLKKEDTDDVEKMLRAFEKAADACSYSFKKRTLTNLANSSQIANITAFQGCVPGSEAAVHRAHKIALLYFQKHAALPDFYGYDFCLIL